MDIRTFREMNPAISSRARFCAWINDQLNKKGLNVSAPYLRDIESGRAIPSLALAIAIEDLTKRSVTVREWAGLAKRKRKC
jgi:hypothetical protein